MLISGTATFLAMSSWATRQQVAIRNRHSQLLHTSQDMKNALYQSGYPDYATYRAIEVLLSRHVAVVA